MSKESKKMFVRLLLFFIVTAMLLEAMSQISFSNRKIGLLTVLIILILFVLGWFTIYILQERKIERKILEKKNLDESTSKKNKKGN